VGIQTAAAAFQNFHGSLFLPRSRVHLLSANVSYVL
jgi:hypothetical protein